ncbi:putative mannosyl-oligosaccharide glucosidase [Trichinella pseudospiralis]|nr:putative mannosyl-oligosaccharide glucosidase [Trichinella pseudospiralis]
MSESVRSKTKKSSSAKRDVALKPTSIRLKHAQNVQLLANCNHFSIFILSVVFAIAFYYFYENYFRNPYLISIPSSLPLALNRSAVANDFEMYWGSYRANLFVGIGGRNPTAPLFGAMWYMQPREGEIIVPLIRHWCDQNIGVGQYGWLEHDSRLYGIQQITDYPLSIETTMIKRPLKDHPGDWTLRVQAKLLDSSSVHHTYSFILYLLLPTSGQLYAKKLSNESSVGLIEGKTNGLGHFRMIISKPKSLLKTSQIQLAVTDIAHLKEIILKNTVIFKDASSPSNVIFGIHEIETSIGNDTNFAAVQLTFNSETTFDIIFESMKDINNRERLTSFEFDKRFKELRKNFEEKFESIFKLKEKQYADVLISAAKHCLSNMLGSISYFHGYSIVQSQFNTHPILYGPHTLFSSIPSRSFFPRGFLWDEGFHQLLIHRWDQKLSFEIIAGWLDLMNTEGWIPREVILGTEAEQKVPAEFLTQRNLYANPPMFFYLIKSTLKNNKLSTDSKEILSRMYPRLRLWYNWLNKSQSGVQPGTYRWRGRNATTDLELNPKTLPSGLDDYPRASHPSDEEYHVDLFSWMALSADVMYELAKLFNDKVWAPRFEADAKFLNDPSLLDRLHWSEKRKRYCDYGLHTKHAVLKRVTISEEESQHSATSRGIMKRVVKGTPQLRLVSDVFGYVNLFPMFLRLIPANSTKLGYLLEQMSDSELLWTPYGLRSLSKKSTCYNQRNTEHDPPYWRGSIWINMNYLAVASLYHYSNVDGPYREIAYKLYSDLRNALVSNVVKEYLRTGFLWEHYNDETGHGEGSHPFTGWTSLTLLMMSELFE